MNEPLPIGFGQTISQPLAVAFMLELLNPKPGEHIMDVGAGSGWQTALLAYIVSKNGKSASAGAVKKRKRIGTVVSMERIPALRVMASHNIAKYNFIEKKAVKVVLGDASRGYAHEAPFDKIIVAASAASIPVAWKREVKVGGRIVAPVDGRVMVLNHRSHSDFDIIEYGGFRFVPLIEDEGGG